MPRNLEKRFELMIPMYDKAIAGKLLDALNLQLKDNVLSWEMQADGTYRELSPNEGEALLDSQAYLENYINKIYKKNTKTVSSDTLSNKGKKIFK